MHFLIHYYEGIMRANCKFVQVQFESEALREGLPYLYYGRDRDRSCGLFAV